MYLTLGGSLNSVLMPKLQLKIRTTPGVLNISQRSGELEIDQSPCRESLGLTDKLTFAKDNAELGRQAVDEFIQQTVAEGDRLAHIESPQNTIGQIIAEKAIQPPYQVTLASKNPPIIRYKANPPVIEYQMGKLDISV